MNITHIVAEFDGISGFFIKALERDNQGNVVDSHTFGIALAAQTGELFQALQNTNMFQTGQLRMKINSIEFSV